MKEKSLLDKVRAVKQILLENDSEASDIGLAVKSLAAVIEGNLFMVDREGKLLESIYSEQANCHSLEEYLLKKGEFPDHYRISGFLADNEPQANVVCSTADCVLPGKEQAPCRGGKVILTGIPVIGGGQRLGTLLLHRFDAPFEHEDTILAETGSALIGMLMMRIEADLQQENLRNKAIAEIAFESLSYSEVEAIEAIINSITENESIVVASKIADDLGITRSVIINALRKFESAGIVESRSLGMKGTYIKVKNSQALAEIVARSSRLKSREERNL